LIGLKGTTLRHAWRLSLGFCGDGAMVMVTSGADRDLQEHLAHAQTAQTQ